MKILIVHPILSYRGGERVAIHLASGLVAQQHEVKLFFLKKDPHVLENIIPQQVPTIIPNSTIQRLFHNTYFLLTIGQLILLFYLLRHARKVDLIQTETFPCLWTATLVAKIYNKKLVVILHSLEQRKQNKLSFHNIALKIIQTINKVCIKHTNSILTVSPKVQRESRKQYPTVSSYMILPPININRLQYPKGNCIRQKYKLNNNKILLCVGVLHYDKNQILAINTLKSIHGTITDCTLILVGSGDQTKLQNTARNLGVSEKVIFAGLVPEDEIKEYYQDCDLLLVTSHSEQEGLGITPFEALYLNTLSVVSNEAGISEIISQEKIGFVSSTTPHNFSEKIVEYLQNPTEYTQMAQLGNRFVKENLTIEAYTKKVLEVYKLYDNTRH